MSLLLARRLVEAGVPFVTVFWMEDEATDDEVQERRRLGHAREQLQLPEGEPAARSSTAAFSALVDDLHDRGLLDSTLVLVTSEMGRKPKIGDPRERRHDRGRPRPLDPLPERAAGRRRHPRRADLRHQRQARPSTRPTARSRPADVARTVYHAMGITDLEARDREGRPYNLLADGEPILDLF